MKYIIVLFFFGLASAALNLRGVKKRQTGGCIYEGQTYQQGQSWTVPCKYNCQCTDGSTGHYVCKEVCPTYSNLPQACQLVQEPGGCCSKPQCNFQPSSGGSSGSGTTGGGSGTMGGGSGTMISSGTQAPPDGDGGFHLFFGNGGSGGTGMNTGSCQDKLPNCKDYGSTVCTDQKYSQWVTENCALFCGKCSVTPTQAPTEGFHLIFNNGGGSGGTHTGPCQDKLPNCKDYGSAVCSDPTYAKWVSDNCPLACGKCVSSGGTGEITVTQGPVMQGSCADKLPNCAQYGATVCTDTRYTAWAHDNCCMFCSHSGGTMTGTGGTMTGTGTGGTMTGTGTGGTMTGTGTGGTMTGTGGTMTGQGTGGTMTGTGTGGGVVGHSTGCVYSGQVYQQGQTWKDGCKYQCTCTNAESGQYSCKDLCVTWNLPNVCHLQPPQQGMCCQTPSCPPNVQIQYPPDYTPQ